MLIGPEEVAEVEEMSWWELICYCGWVMLKSMFILSPIFKFALGTL